MDTAGIVLSEKGPDHSYWEARSISQTPVVVWGNVPFLRKGQKRVLAMSYHGQDLTQIPQGEEKYPAFWFAYPGTPLLREDQGRGLEKDAGDQAQNDNVEAAFSCSGGPTRCGFEPTYTFVYVGPKSPPSPLSITI